MSPQSEPPAEPDRSDESRAEQVLAQALNVMAGGKSGQQERTGEQLSRAQLSTTQLLLFAAVVGLLVGIALGLISLAW